MLVGMVVGWLVGKVVTKGEVHGCVYWVCACMDACVCVWLCVLFKQQNLALIFDQRALFMRKKNLSSCLMFTLAYMHTQ